MPAAQTSIAEKAGSWIVVNTHPHREGIAVENLARQEFSAYCPKLRRTIRHARRASDVLRPLFPGYVFVAVNPDIQQWRPILSTLGVRSLIRFGDKPSLIDDAFIESLKAREIDGAVTKPACPYKIGQQVRMTSGPCDGLVATILEMDERDRLVVLMEMLNRPRRVKVDARLVSPV